MLRKSTFREIRSSRGRYFAILAIVALGVGFFAGLRTTKEAMIRTADAYLKKQGMYDFRLMTTIGYDDDSVTRVREAKGVREAEGVFAEDVIASAGGGDDKAFRVLSIPDKVATPALKAGRLPSASDECVIDSAFGGETLIGKKIVLSDRNTEKDRDRLHHREFRITGTVTSPQYLNKERGNTDLLDGTLSAFVYVDRDAFAEEVYTEILVRIDSDARYCTPARSRAIEKREAAVRSAAEDAATARYDAVLDEVRPLAQRRGMSAEAVAEAAGVRAPYTYVLDSGDNAGYATFDNNAEIVSSIARIFPAFFFLVAALVCMTTMTRMIDEQRMQIGVMKALGYSNAAVLSKYLFYSGSAALIGAAVGFAGGTKLFPMVIWKAYHILYEFSDGIVYVVNLPLAWLSLGVALLCSMGATWVSCANDFRVMPAQLIRPKAPKSGKRILLERIPAIWKHISFLYKVSIRNTFRYKKRFLMMVLGISGCTALLIAGLGINTTVKNVARFQFDEILRYDYAVAFEEAMDEGAREEFVSYMEGKSDGILFVRRSNAEAVTAKEKTAITLVVVPEKDFSRFVHLHDGARKVAFPKQGEAVICRKLHTQAGIGIGDTVAVEEDGKRMTFTVSGICDNYVEDYLYVSEETYREKSGAEPERKTAFVRKTKGASARTLRREATFAGKHDKAAGTMVNIDMLSRVDQMMKSLDSVIFVIILAAGVLAFIVLYNLTNINMTERIREIATIEVLGFYDREIQSYVFRENLLLTGISALVGLPLGRCLLNFVVHEINVEMIYFVPRITRSDYLYAVLLTFVFALLVNLVMRRKLVNINMTEALKSVE